MNNKKSAFSLVELLVVISIIALLSTLITISFSNIKRNNRDSKRISDIVEIQIALEAYKFFEGSYPNELHPGGALIGENSGNAYMIQIPQSPVYQKFNCPTDDYDYFYNNESGGYEIDFCLEGKIENYSPGIKCAIFGGILDNACTPPQCGEYDVTFTYKGSPVTYGTVLNPATEKCWLDRNLGATQVAASSNDANAYGDLFQWGRLDDGHQTRASGLTSTLSTTDTPGHANFITNSTPPYDWRNPQNNNLWQGVNGVNNPCPSGWRIPTEAEWNAERLSWTSDNSAGALASPLKLTVAGARDGSGGSLYGVGSDGYYWSSSVSGSNSRYLYFDTSDADVGSYDRSDGLAVRCLKDY